MSHFRMIGVMLGCAVTVCLVNATEAQAGPAPVTWTVWEYNGGAFVKQPNGSWVEYQGGQLRYSFRAAGTDGNCLFLYDASRDMTVRLSPSTMHLKWPQTNFQWQFFFQGRPR